MSCADAGHRLSEATKHSGTRMEARGLSVISFPSNVTRFSIMNFFTLRAYSSHSFSSWSTVPWLRGDDDENRTTSPDEHAFSELDDFTEIEIKLHAEKAETSDCRGRRATFYGNEDILLSRRRRMHPRRCEWLAAKETYQKHIRIICLRIYMKCQSISLVNHRTRNAQPKTLTPQPPVRRNDCDTRRRNRRTR